MRNALTVLSVSLLCLRVSAVFQRRWFKPVDSSSSGGGADTDDNANTILDIQYTTNITLNGKSIHVVLDTENPDLWILPSSNIGTFNDTKLPATIQFADDVNKVEGTIGVASFEFGQHTIPRQAFLYAKQSTLDPLYPQHGIHGSFGLGFSLEKVSPVNQAIKKEYGVNATWGQSFLTNIFQAFPDRPNFIGFDLTRDESKDKGSFTIGEYDPEYGSRAASAPKLVQFPQNAGRWSTLVDKIVVDGKAGSVSWNKSVNGETPSGRAIVLLSTTSVKNVFPRWLGNQIYGAVAGAVRYEEEGEGEGGIWIVPCDAAPEVRFEFGGQSYPIHPLDLSSVKTDVLPSGKNITACIATYLEDDDRGDGAYDIVLGNTFLRNVYSIFDFGDEKDGFTTEPYMQFVSKTDYNQAVEEFKKTRAAELNGLERPLDPEDLVRVLKDNEGAKSSSSDLTKNGDGSSVGTESSLMAKYAPAIVALLVVNLVVLVVVLGFVVVGFVRRGGVASSRGSGGGGGGVRASPSTRPHYTKIRDDEAHEMSAYKNPYDP